MKKCQYCAEEIQDEAVICRYCHVNLQTGKTTLTPPQEVRARSGIKDGVKLGCGMFIVLPLILIGIIIILGIIFSAIGSSTNQKNLSTIKSNAQSVVTKKTVSQPTTQQPLRPNEIAGGFTFNNVVLKDAGFGSGAINVIGELTNNAGKDYDTISFVMSLYDRDGKLLGSNYIILNNFLNGQTKTFDTIILNTDYSLVAKYKIQFETGF